MSCAVYNGWCPVHGFQHGAEAEELREGIESLMERFAGSVPNIELQALLDRVDARDSVARLDAMRKSP